MHLLGLNPVSDQRAGEKNEQCTCPSSNIAFDVNNHLMDVILHVWLILINQDFAACIKWHSIVPTLGR